MAKICVCWVSVLLVVAACSSGTDDSSGLCVPTDCAQQCQAAGRPNGECVGGMCQCTGGGGDADADADPDVEAGADADADADPDGETGADDGGPEDAEEIEVDPCAPASCMPSESCGETTFGDGIDNDCDTEVDEGCTCGGSGTSLECFPGDPAICPAGQPCSGGCTRGVETCTEFLIWSACVGAVGPQDERCDGLDNDCDTLYDEGIDGCDSPVICPSTFRAAPMSWVPLDGGSIFPGTYDSWTWQLFCPVTVDPCPTPEDPSARDTQVFLISSGTYRARATIVVGDDTYTCEFAVVTQGEGLRVELNWDSRGSAAGDTDVDLHLHQWGGTSAFFASPQDCYYANCKASSCCWGGAPEVDWGLTPTSDLAACRDAPHGEGDEWVAYGSCLNPRLDVDVIYCESGVTDATSPDFCAPENINVDNPPLYEPMRIMVNYYSDHGFSGVTNATINVYCGGALRGSFGPQALNYGSDYGESNDNWLVADVMFYEGACGALDCEIVPLELVQRGAAFGPAWSTFVHTP